MAPLIALLVGTALARLAGLAGVAALDGWHRRAARRAGPDVRADRLRALRRPAPRAT